MVKYIITHPYAAWFPSGKENVVHRFVPGEVVYLAGLELSTHSSKSPFHYKGHIIRIPNDSVKKASDCSGCAPHIFKNGDPIWIKQFLDNTYVLRYYARFENGKHYYYTGQRNSGGVSSLGADYMRKFDPNDLPLTYKQDLIWTRTET